MTARDLFDPSVAVGGGGQYLMHMAASVMAMQSKQAIYSITAFMSPLYFEGNTKSIALGQLTLTWVWSPKQS